ncbi:MAG: ubiquitin-like small modifier protein 1 [Bradymonadaceae bacterium]
MSVSVRIPTPLRKHTDGEEEVEVSGSTAGEVLKNLAERYPELRDKLFDEDGGLRRFVNVFANEEDIRHAEELETTVEDGDQVSIVPAMAGG